jgi:predicted HAD superfamily Cof-like phosphohydrolase
MKKECGINHHVNKLTMSKLKFQELISLVKEFHDSFQIKNGKNNEILSTKEALLRFKLMEEENLEYIEACEKKDIVQIADALGDMLYILCGTILKHGLDNSMEDVFLEIQKSNMSKLDKNNKPIINDGIIDPSKPKGKVLKGENYKPPNLSQFLK